MSINIEDFDFSVKPSEDFNLFVNGTWKKNNKIPDKYTKWGSFEILHESNLQKLKSLIEDCNKDDIYKNIGIIYKLAMDESRLEKEGIDPLKCIVQTINVATTKEELWKTLGILYKYGIAGIFGTYPQEDAKNSTFVVIYISTSGLGLPDKDYYFLKEKEETRNKYKNYIKDLLLLYNPNWNDIENIDNIVQQIYNFEEKLAEVTFTKVEKRDPEKNYNKITILELNKLTNLDWISYFKELNINMIIPYIVADNLCFYKFLGNLWSTTDLNILKNYILYKSISNSASYLNNAFVNLKFNFYGKFLSGQKEIKPRWEKAITMVESNLGELLGRKYCEKYFTENSKKKMLDMVTSLNSELKQRLTNLTWMSCETKKKAFKKQEVFKAKIGYPDKWRDFSKLELGTNCVDINCNNKSLLNVIMDCNLFNHDYEVSRLYKPTDPDKWEMDPQMINAYFHPIRNEIVFPAGILQPPFFYPDGDDGLNYGAIGTVIGHEMTHSYDDMGSKFDHEGNLNDWWTDIDKTIFNEKSKYFVDEYSKCLVNGKNVNGELTLGENLADHGGVKISYYALKKKLDSDKTVVETTVDKNNFNIFKRFFISWALVWRCNITDQETDKRLLTDPHSPNELRINCTLCNIPEFHKEFNIKDKMFRKSPTQMW
jgi:putative endopeptidase